MDGRIAVYGILAIAEFIWELFCKSYNSEELSFGLSPGIPLEMAQAKEVAPQMMQHSCKKLLILLTTGLSPIVLSF
jgi:hypothetical protein